VPGKLWKVIFAMNIVVQTTERVKYLKIGNRERAQEGARFSRPFGTGVILF